MATARARVWDFVDTLEDAASVGAVADAFVAAMARLGFERVGLLSDVDPLNPGPHGVSIISNQEDWIAHYSGEGYHRVDPIQRTARRRATPFAWSDPKFREGLSAEQLRMMSDLDEAKLGYGVAIPLRSPGELPATCALFTNGEEVGVENYALAHSMAVFAHAAACRRLRDETGEPEETPPKLTARERECLIFAARGKSDWQIGQILTLSERTVHHAIERAKRRLGVATRVQAIVRAIHHGEFTTADAAE
jgi:DNA-binding CsgD family transcriptional regulator